MDKFWEFAPAWIQAVAAVAMLVFSAVLYRLNKEQKDLMQRQTTTMHRQTMIAEKQANISTRQADIAADQTRITREIERGFLSVALTASLERKDAASGHYEFTFELRNTGRTPISVAQNVLSVQDRSEPPPVFGASIRIGAYLAPGDQFTKNEYETFNPPSAPSGAADRWVVVAGFISYRDEFGNERRRGFGFEALIPYYFAPLPSLDRKLRGLPQPDTTIDNLNLWLTDALGFNYDRATTVEESVEK